MKVKKILVGMGIVELIIGIIFLGIMVNSSTNNVMAWIGTLALLIFGLFGTIIAAIGSS